MVPAGTLPIVSTNRSTSIARVQLDSMLSGVWKSTGVTMVIRLRTFSGCNAA